MHLWFNSGTEYYLVGNSAFEIQSSSKAVFWVLYQAVWWKFTRVLTLETAYLSEMMMS